MIWFSASLWFQGIQLEEQRKQLEEQREHFTKEFAHLQEAGRRDSILIVKGILDAAEQQSIKHNGSISTISELPTLYLKVDEFGVIMKSQDTDEVAAALNSWMKKEAAATIFLKGIKSAAEVYLRAVGALGIDYSKIPEEFVYIYGSRFWNVPFFSSYEGTAVLLAHYMYTLQPARAAAQIATLGVASKLGGKELFRTEKLGETLDAHRKKQYPIPKIAEHL